MEESDAGLVVSFDERVEAVLAATRDESCDRVRIR